MAIQSALRASTPPCSGQQNSMYTHLIQSRINFRFCRSKDVPLAAHAKSHVGKLAWCWACSMQSNTQRNPKATPSPYDHTHSLFQRPADIQTGGKSARQQQTNASGQLGSHMSSGATKPSSPTRQIDGGCFHTPCSTLLSQNDAGVCFLRVLRISKTCSPPCEFKTTCARQERRARTCVSSSRHTSDQWPSATQDRSHLQLIHWRDHAALWTAHGDEPPCGCPARMHSPLCCVGSSA